MLIFLIAMLLAPSAIYAYLDPGSGAVLVNLLIAGVAALLFSLKGFFLRLIGKKAAPQKTEESKARIAILSEGKQYWATFKPIIEALIDKALPFAYYTLDIEDPALAIEHDLMDARFLGYNLANFRAGRLQADYLLCTTPNIGCPNYPIQKSPQLKNLIHIFHSINDLAMYRKGSLDHYDTVFMVGDWQAKSIRELEVKRGLKPKQLVSLGLPYLDLYQKDVKEKKRGERPCILVASSWGQKGLLFAYGIDFIKSLAAEYRVIVRPHPQSYKSEAQKIKSIEKELRKYDISWDRDISPVKSMQQADLLISDTSSIRFDFAFLHQRPVITLEVEADAMPGYEREDMDELWMDQAAERIGKQIGKKDLDKLPDVVNELLHKFDPQNLLVFRQSTIANFGEAGKAIADYLSDCILSEDSRA